MSSFVKASGGITPNSADPGEEFPFLHTITVVDRVVSVDKPELVQNNINTETVTLNLDSEWEGLSTVINIGNDEPPTSLIWSGQPVVIPAELMTDVGALNVSVVGYGDDGAVRSVTKKADAKFTVVASGYVEDDVPVPDPTTLLGQLIQAADNANQAADRFNQASEDIESIGPAIEKVQASEANAKQSETNAASSAESASQSASTASTSAEAARTSETNAATSATAAQQAVDGFGLTVGSVTTGEPGTDASVDITKDGTKYTANFTIPRGDKGEQASVEHDATLTGDGTSRTPLGVADGTAIKPVDNKWSAIDFNDFYTSGIYTFNCVATNAPMAKWSSGALIVLRSYQSIVQVYFSYHFSSQAQMAIRYAAINAAGDVPTAEQWTAWKRMASVSDTLDVSALTSRIAALESKLNELAVVQTRQQALEARIKSLETN